MAYGGGLGEEAKKRWKPIFRMNGLFQGESEEEKGRERERGSEIEKGRRQERGVLHDFKLTIIVGCDMYYVSWGFESWAHFHGEEGNKSPMSQFERVQLAWAPHLTANYNSSSSKSLPQLSKANLTMHSLLLASLDVQLTECSSHSLPLLLPWKNKTLTSKSVFSCSSLHRCNEKITAV